ncbi:MAG: hypothetical protein AAFX06_11685 [Planctomycetota bacterium]
MLVTVSAVWLGVHLRRTQCQREAIAAILEYGGWIRYDYQMTADRNFDPEGTSWVPEWLREIAGEDFFHSVVDVSFVYSEDSGVREENDAVTIAPLESVANLPRVRQLLLSGTQVDDASLRHVRKLKHLRAIYMWDASEVSDEGFRNLQGLPRLELIHLSKSRITDKSLEIASRMPSLQVLSMQYNDFSDEGVRHLAALPNLKSLWVCGSEERPNQITNESLQFLLNSSQLDRLGVQHTYVTFDFVTELQTQFPNSMIAHRLAKRNARGDN